MFWRTVFLFGAAAGMLPHHVDFHLEKNRCLAPPSFLKSAGLLPSPQLRPYKLALILSNQMEETTLCERYLKQLGIPKILAVDIRRQDPLVIMKRESRGGISPSEMLVVIDEHPSAGARALPQNGQLEEMSRTISSYYCRTVAFWRLVSSPEETNHQQDLSWKDLGAEPLSRAKLHRELAAREGLFYQAGLAIFPDPLLGNIFDSWLRRHGIAVVKAVPNEFTAQLEIKRWVDQKRFSGDGILVVCDHRIDVSRCIKPVSPNSDILEINTTPLGREKYLEDGVEIIRIQKPENPFSLIQGNPEESIQASIYLDELLEPFGVIQGGEFVLTKFVAFDRFNDIVNKLERRKAVSLMNELETSL